MKNLQKSLLLVILLFLVACSQISVPPIDSQTRSTAESIEETIQNEPVFQNPIIQENFADPFILKVDTTYFVYATNSSGKNISLAKSNDLIQWQILRCNACASQVGKIDQRIGLGSGSHSN